MSGTPKNAVCTVGAALCIYAKFATTGPFMQTAFSTLVVSVRQVVMPLL